MKTLPLLCCLVTTVAWGVWSLALKKATATTNPLCVQVVGTLMGLPFIAVHLIALRAQNVKFEVAGSSLPWIALAAVFAAIAAIANLVSLSKMDLGVATALTSTYPVVALLLSMSLGMESMTTTKAFGTALVVVGVIFLSRS